VLHPEQAGERAESPEGKMREPQLDAGLAVPRTRDQTSGEGGSVRVHLKMRFKEGVSHMSSKLAALPI
jgi:hypothetical protein